MDVYFSSQKGKRTNNEDSILINKLLINHSEIKLKKYSSMNKVTNKFLISDGMGGLEFGEIASKLILEPFSKIIKKYDIDLLKKLIYKAKQNLEEYALFNNIEKNMGGTIAGIFISNANNFLAFNIGDSRIYKISKDEVHLLSKDHSLAQKLYEEGEISKEILPYHSSRNVLLSAITAFHPINDMNFIYGELNKNEYLLMCSDGVWEQLPDNKIISIFKHRNINSLLKKLLNEINISPEDNCSFILIKK